MCRSRRASEHSLYFSGVTGAGQACVPASGCSSHSLFVKPVFTALLVPHLVREASVPASCASPPIAHHVCDKYSLFVIFRPTYPHGLVGRRRRLGWVGGGGGGGYYGPVYCNGAGAVPSSPLFRVLAWRRGWWWGHRPSCYAEVSRTNRTGATNSTRMMDAQTTPCPGPGWPLQATLHCYSVILYGLASNVS